MDIFGDFIKYMFTTEKVYEGTDIPRDQKWVIVDHTVRQVSPIIHCNNKGQIETLVCMFRNDGWWHDDIVILSPEDANIYYYEKNYNWLHPTEFEGFVGEEIKE